MKKWSIVLVLILSATISFGGSLREYRFSTVAVPTANPPYYSGIIYDALLFNDFSADSAVLDDVVLYEAEKDFNLELKKQLIMYGVTLYDYLIPYSFSEETASTIQAGTLNIDSVEEGLSIDYSVSSIEETSVVLSGEIEYFEFKTDFENSYVVITLNLFDKDSGEVLWLTTLSGKAGDVIDYISDTLTHEPIDESITLQKIEEVEAEVEEEIINRLPEISFSIEPQEVIIKDVAKIPTVKFNVTIESAYLITDWTIDIYDAETNVIKTFTGTDSVPLKTEWDLLDESGNLIEFDSDYTVIVTVTDEIGNKISQPLDMAVSMEVAE